MTAPATTSTVALHWQRAGRNVDAVTGAAREQGAKELGESEANCQVPRASSLFEFLTPLHVLTPPPPFPRHSPAVPLSCPEINIANVVVAVSCAHGPHVEGHVGRRWQS
jgi:hypothetical protein